MTPKHFIIFALLFTLGACANPAYERHLKREARLNKLMLVKPKGRYSGTYFEIRTRGTNFKYLYDQYVQAGRIVHGSPENCFRSSPIKPVINYYGFYRHEIALFREFACNVKVESRVDMKQTIKNKMYDEDINYRSSYNVKIRSASCLMKDKGGIDDFVISEICL